MQRKTKPASNRRTKPIAAPIVKRRGRPPKAKPADPLVRTIAAVPVPLGAWLEAFGEAPALADRLDRMAYLKRRAADGHIEEAFAMATAANHIRTVHARMVKMQRQSEIPDRSY